jgi:NAD(P)-dependent dehydrogenase (short-subunit alcohol dehydrogenase family)
MTTLAGKLALITGGGRGIGAACARALAKDGARVIVCGRTRTAIEAVARETGGTAIACDLADRADGDRLVARVAEVGRVDILVNNAGIAESASLDHTTDAMWDRILELDATSPFRLTRALVPAMITAGWGRVVNIASNAGVSGYAYTAAYCAAKHAMVGWTRALAIDLAKTGVTINALCPGWVRTQMSDEAVARIVHKTGRDEAAARGVLEAQRSRTRCSRCVPTRHAASTARRSSSMEERS